MSKNDTLDLMELRLALMQHATSLRAVINLLLAGKTEGAIARLDGAVTALEATCRAQVGGITMRCPQCDAEQDVVAWVDNGKCNACGTPLELPE